MRSIHRRVRPALSVPVVVLGAVAAAMLLSGCIPAERSEPRKVDDGPDAAKDERDAPTFPDIGNVSDELVAEGLAFDFTNQPRDQDYWTPSAAEAECAAQQVVTSLGAERLVGLGYRPGVPGASLNDVALEDDERAQVVDAFENCVDMVEGLAAMLYGDGRMPTRVALCVARGMGESRMLTPFIEAWASGRAVDPFAEDSAFASALVSHANICIPESAFNWPDVHLPGSDPIIDSDAPAGSDNSPYVDDTRRRSATTTTTTPTTATTTAP